MCPNIRILIAFLRNNSNTCLSNIRQWSVAAVEQSERDKTANGRIAIAINERSKNAVVLRNSAMINKSIFIRDASFYSVFIRFFFIFCVQMEDEWQIENTKTKKQKNTHPLKYFGWEWVRVRARALLDAHQRNLERNN